jgi:hypothetical protein
MYYIKYQRQYLVFANYCSINTSLTIIRNCDLINLYIYSFSSEVFLSKIVSMVMIVFNYECKSCKYKKYTKLWKSAWMKNENFMIEDIKRNVQMRCINIH